MAAWLSPNDGLSPGAMAGGRQSIDGEMKRPLPQPWAWTSSSRTLGLRVVVASTPAPRHRTTLAGVPTAGAGGPAWPLRRATRPTSAAAAAPPPTPAAAPWPTSPRDAGGHARRGGRRGRLDVAA
jgi:hypothetical protein